MLHTYSAPFSRSPSSILMNSASGTVPASGHATLDILSSELCYRASLILIILWQCLYLLHDGMLQDQASRLQQLAVGHHPVLPRHVLSVSAAGHRHLPRVGQGLLENSYV